MPKPTSLIQKRRNPFTGQMMEMVVFPTDLANDSSVSVSLDRSAKPTSAKKITKEGCRFGGPALLPKDMEWPEGPNGALTFVGQLDFSELAKAHKGKAALPDSGILSFFYDVEGMPSGMDRADTESWRFVFVDDPKKAVLHEPEGDDPISPYALAPSLKKPAKNAPLHKVVGVGDWIQEDPRPSVALLAEGIECSVSAVRAAEKKGRNVGALAKKAASWRLLWQIDTDETVGFAWFDVGMLYLLITEADLEKRHFDRAWVQLQCH